MSLNMYLGEVQNQTQSMNAVCTATIQGMEQAIQSIDAFATDTVLQGQTYSSAKSFFVQTFRPLAQGIIYLCEELIRQNNAFPSQFQSQVASTDVIEHEILEQIREIDRMKTSMEAVNQAMPMPGMDAMVNLFIVMRQKLQEKLDHLYQFNQTSSNNYSTALQLATSIAAGLAEVQSGKGFNAASGTFNTQVLNMGWTTSIQKITEKKTREADKIAQARTQKDDKDKIKYFTGKAEWKDGERVGAVLEGSVIDGKEPLGNNSEWNMKALSGKIDVNVPLPFAFDAAKEDLMAGNIIGAKIEGSALENSFKTTKIKVPITTFIGPIGPIRFTPKEITITQKFGEANFTTGVEKYTLKLAAELTANKYEAELNLFHIPDFVPFIGDCDVIAKGEVGLGTFGFKAKLGAETGGYFGEEFGLGGFIKFEKPKKEES
ncbi:T7SS effector LXG polymorphic toxin [Bacillus mycoides]|uniref:Ribonuclease n=1 Tax=Bacillus mycoides TaxID=1405 RepID=A0A1D3MUC8_BACMY|nr:T7SS effector LXG polymorphic toxin [Bacillus mycoides]OFE00267.1 Ribonuclease [Bacillus mycoides]OFE03370.1 Ribonuclease [Bacillus mycoides]OHX33134.1 Ribonuclease [Bacillus mycoides]SCM89561.1 Uncharacterized protein BWAI21_05033 [Bacillus mycoides]